MLINYAILGSSILFIYLFIHSLIHIKRNIASQEKHRNEKKTTVWTTQGITIYV